MNVKIINVGHTKIVVKLELMWVQDPRCFCKFPIGVPTNIKISITGQMCHKINNHHIHMFG